MANFTKFKIDYDIKGKDPREIEKLIQSAVDEVMNQAEVKPGAFQIFPAKNQTRWELSVTTAPDSPPCQGPVEVVVCGVRADDDPDRLQVPNDGSKPFQPGKTDIFTIEIDKDIGDIFKVRFGFPKSVTEAEWKLKSFKLVHPRNKDTFETDCDLTVKKSPTQDSWQEVFVVWPDYPLLPLINYHVAVHTSDKSGEMDCGGDILIYGDYGNSGVRSLRSTASPKFQPGKVDEFRVPIIKLGQVRKVRMINDLTGSNSKWMIDKVVIKESPEAEEQWEFPCGRYFDPKSGDGKFDRVLQPGQEPEDPEPPKPPSPLPEPPPRPVPKEEPKPKPKPEPEPKDMPPEEPEPKDMPPEEPEPKDMPPEEPEPKDMPPEEKPASKKVEKPKPKERPKEKPKTPPPKPKPKEEKKEPDPIKEPDAPENLWEIWWENRDAQKKYKDVELGFIVVGEKAKTDQFDFQVELKPGESPKLSVEFTKDEVGEVDKVRVKFADQVKKTTKWDVAKLHLKHLKSGEIHTFEFEKPIIKKEHDSTVEASDKGDKIAVYEVELHTADRLGLFDDDVKAKLIVRGETGDTGERVAVNAQANGKLTDPKPGGILRFSIEGIDFGDIKGVSFKHNKPGKKAADFIQRLVVRPSHQPENEYAIEFDKEIPDTLWELWWENRSNQKKIKDVSLGFIVVGEEDKTDLFDFTVNLEPGESAKNELEFDKEEIGPVDKVRIKLADEVKKSTQWEIAKLHLKHVKTEEIHTFEFEKPIIKKEGDSTAESSLKGEPISIYQVEMHTSDRTGLFDDNVRAKILVRGEEGDLGERTAVNAPIDGRLKINPGAVLRFEIEGVNIGDIRGIAFKHNKPGYKTADFVQRIVVRPSHQPENEYAVEFNRPPPPPPPPEPDDLWDLWWENRKKQAVFPKVRLGFIVVGEKSVTKEFDFVDDLKAGLSKKHRMKFDGETIGPVEKVRICFAENVKLKTAWELAKLHVMNVKSEELHTFEFEKPIVKKQRDSTVEASNRGIPISIYEIEMHTADRPGLFATDVAAKVSVLGESGNTGERMAVNAPVDGKLKMKQGEVLKFDIEGVDIGDIKGVDFTTNKPEIHLAEFVHKIIVRPTHKKTAEFVVEYNRPPPTKHSAPVSDLVWEVWWENRQGQGNLTEVPVGFTVVGNKGSTNQFDFKVELKPGVSDKKKMVFDIAKIGNIDKVRIRFADQVKKKTKWEIAKLHLRSVKTEEQHTFEFTKPAVKRTGDSSVEASKHGIPISIYEVQMFTGERPGLFDDDVCIRISIKGERGDTGERTAVNTKTDGAVAIKQGGVLKFDIEGIDIGEITGISLWHNKEGAEPGLFVEKVVVTPSHHRNGEYIVFFDWKKSVTNETWFLWWENRKTQQPYKEVNLYFTIVGDRGCSDPFDFTVDLIKGESKKREVEFFSSEVGSIEKVRIRFDEDVKAKTIWDISKLHLLHALTNEKHTFEFDKPAVKKKGDSIVEASSRGVPITIHEVELHSGNRLGLFDEGGIVAKVIIRGEDGDTGKRTMFNTLTEKPDAPLRTGMILRSEIEGVDIGEVSSVQFIHNKPGKKAGDFVSKIVVRPLHLKDVEYVFEYENTGTGVVIEHLAPEEDADPREWIMSWSNYKDQPIDDIQISVILFGQNGQSNPYYLDIHLEAGNSEEHTLVVEEDIGELIKLRFGHGPKTTGNHPWKVREVRMKHVKTGVQHIFKMGAPPPKPAVQTLQPKYRAEIYIHMNARKISAKAAIYMRMKGTKAVSDKCWLKRSLNNDIRFQPGSVDIFEITESPEVGDVQNITFGGVDENTVSTLRKSVTKVVVVPLHWKERKEFVFNFNNNPSPPPPEPAPVAPPPSPPKRDPKYRVEVYVRKTAPDLRDTTVCIRMKGTKVVSDKCWLHTSLTSPTRFLPGGMDAFEVDSEELGDIQNVAFEGPDKTAVATFRNYVSKVLIVPLHWKTRKEFVFSFNAPSAPTAPPPPTQPKHTWLIKVRIGNHGMSTTRTPLCIAVCSMSKTSETIALREGAGFVPNQVYQFKTELDELDEVFKIRLGFEDYTQMPTLFIEEVILEAINGPQYVVPVGQWVWGGYRHDSWREFLAKKAKLQLKVFKYQLAVWTGSSPGTDGTAFVEFIGSRGDSGKRRLANSKSHVRKLGAEQMDLFDIEAIDLGDVKKAVVTFSGNSSWHLRRMLLQAHPLGGQEFIFDCNKIFNASNPEATMSVTLVNDGKPYETGSASDHLVFVSTGPKPEMATNSTVSLTVFGDKASLPPSVLIKNERNVTASKIPLPPPPTFRSGACDSFQVKIPVAKLGTIVKCRMEHNNVGNQPTWFLDKFTLQSLTNPREFTLHFDVNAWLSTSHDDGDIIREKPACYFEKPSAIDMTYEVTLDLGTKTSPTMPPGTNVFCTLCGKSPLTSGKRALKKSVGGTPYLLPSTASSFKISAVGVGEVTKVIMNHDSTELDYQLEIRMISIKWDGPPKGGADFPVNRLLAKAHPSKDAELIVGK